MKRTDAADREAEASDAHSAQSQSTAPRASRWRRARDNIWPSWTTRDMGFLLAARVCMSATRALAGVLVPIYLALIGYSGFALGALFAVVALSSAALTALIGVLSDRMGRKIFIVVIPWLAAAAALVFALTRYGPLIFTFAALGSFGRGAGAGAGTVGPYQPAEQALLADAVYARHRNSLFGRIAFASSLGALIGSGPLTVLPGVLGRFGLPVTHGLAPYRFSFVVLAGMSLLAGILAIPVREARPVRDPVPAAPVSGRRWRRPHLRLSAKTRPILYRLWATNTVNGLAVGFFGPFITYWFFRRYGAGASVVGPLFAVINLAAMVSNLLAARFAAWLGVVRAITVSRALQAVLIVPMVLAPTFWLAGAFYLLRMLAQRMGLPLRQSYVMGVVAPEERGSVAALSNLPSQAASAVSPTAAGYLFDHVALALPFEIGALLQAVNTVMFFVFFRALRPPEESERRQPAP